MRDKETIQILGWALRSNNSLCHPAPKTDTDTLLWYSKFMLANPSFAPIVNYIEPLSCCCSDIDCEALNHNKQIMRQLETELRTAGELGQILLDKHDSYIKEVEQERRQFLAEIERQSSFAKLVDELEMSNRELEYQNLCTMRDNASLLKRLEDLNASLNQSEAQNYQLRTTLVETESEVGRLSHKTVKAKGLESQILTLELERSGLEQEMEILTRSNNQNHSRYAQAEKQVAELQRQLEQMQSNESPSLQDSLEFCVQTPMHTSKGLFAPSTQKSKDTEFSNVVSELLSSNISLEESSSEMRRVLEDSQDEIVSLRQQLLLQQDQRDGLTISEETHGPRKTVSQELHQHHHYHYHVPTKSIDRKSRSKIESSRRSQNAGLVKPEEHVPEDMMDRPYRVKHRHTPLDTSTPIRKRSVKGRITGSSLLSSRPSGDDSGYFSIASSHYRDRSVSLVHQASPSPLDKQGPRFDKDLHGSFNARQRSNSHESIFSYQPLGCPPVSDKAQVGSVLQGLSLESVSSGNMVASVGHAEHKDEGPTLRHSTSHESIMDRVQRPSQAELLLGRLNNVSMRRPFASPLQNAASEATVSVTSATADSYKQQGSRHQSPRASSYNALKIAAAAQKVTSPGSTCQAPGPNSSTFWKRNSERSLPTVQRPGIPSRWTSFVRWNSPSTQNEGDIKVGGEGAMYNTQVKPAKLSSRAGAVENLTSARTAITNTSSSVQLSSVEKDLLRDALA